MKSMKIFIFMVIISLVILKPEVKAEGLNLDGFVETSFEESRDKDNMFKYWSDYLPKERKDVPIYRYFTVSFSENSKDVLFFTQIFDINVCGAYNCPYKVFLRTPSGKETLVLEGIGFDEENAFKIKWNKDKPITINTGIMIFDYNEKKGIYDERK